MKYKIGEKVRIYEKVPIVIIPTFKDFTYAELCDGSTLGEGVIENVDDIFEMKYLIRFANGTAHLKEMDYLIPESVYNTPLYKVMK